MIRDNEITNFRTDNACILTNADDSPRDSPPPDGIIIEGNLIHDCGNFAFVEPGQTIPKRSKLDHGIYANDARNMIIRDNWIYDNAARGVQLSPDADDSLVVGNVIDGNGEGVDFGCGLATCSEGNLVQGNVIANSERSWNVYGNNPDDDDDGPFPSRLNHLFSNCLYAPDGRLEDDNGGVDNDERFFTELDGPENVKNINPGYVAADADNFQLSGGRCQSVYMGTMSLP